MNRFHFNVGDSAQAHIGLCATVRADTQEEAVKILQQQLPEIVRCDANQNSQIEYINTYINPDAFSKNDIDDVASLAND